MNHGSLINQIAGTNPELVPTVGMGATKMSWSDRDPFTVVEVLTTKAGKVNGVVVQSDNAERTDDNGQSECQSYTFTPDPNGYKVTLVRNRKGQWHVKGEPGSKFCLGSRDKYRDPSF
jgi:hypothetical protein